MFSFIGKAFASLLFLFWFPIGLMAAVDSLAHQTYSSTIVIAEDLGIVGVIKNDPSSLSFLSVDNLSVIHQLFLADAPSSVAYDESTGYFYVASTLNSNLLVISGKTFKEIANIKLDKNPSEILTAQAYLVVSNAKFGTISIYDKYNLTLLKVLDIGGDPRGISYLRQKGMIYVADLMNGSIAVVTLNDLSVVKKINMGETATLTHSVIFDFKNNLAYVPQTFRNNSNRSLQFDTTVFPSLSIISLSTNTNIRKKRIGIDVVDEPIGIPLSGAILDQHLYIANYASNDLTILSLDTLTLAAHLELGSTPFGLAVDSINSKVLINNTLDGTVSVIDSNDLVLLENIKIIDMDENSPLLKGERLFSNSHDIRLAKDQWIACSTCHFEGGSDKSSWFFPDGKRSTPSLFNVINTAPFHWNGDLDEIHDVEFTIQGIMSGEGLSGGLVNCDPNCASDKSNAGRSSDLDDLASYIESLKYPTSVTVQNNLVNREAYEQGYNIFHSAQTGCAVCHKPPYYMDNDNHTINLASPGGALSSINTPSLLGLRDSAPYLHDGSASDLKLVLQRTQEISDHGNIDHLSDMGIYNLLVFLRNIVIPEEAADTPSYGWEYNELNVAPEEQISTADIDFSYLIENGVGTLRLSTNISSNAPSDIYLAFFNIDSGDFFMIDKNLELGAANTILIYKEADKPINLINEKIYNFNFDPSSFSGLRFQFYTIIVVKNKSIYETDNWSSFDIELMEF